MGIHGPVMVTANWGETPVVSEGQFWRVLYPDGSVFAAGFRGATQDHPDPYAGGNYLDLSKVPESAINGWNVLVGPAPVQSAAGLTVTCKAGDLLSTIDVPALGSFVLADAVLFMSVVCAAPGAGAFAGLEGLTQAASGSSWGAVIHSDSVDWEPAIKINSLGSFVRSTFNPIALAGINAVTYARMSVGQHTTNNTLRSFQAIVGTQGPSLAVLGVQQSNYTIGEDVTVPDTVQARLVAGWTASDDVVVTYHGIAVRTPLVTAMVS